MELVRSYCPINGGPPTKHGGRAPALIVSRPAQRSLHVTACMLAKSPKRPSTPEAPTASFPPPPLRLLPGGANPVPGRDFHPQSTSAFSRRTRNRDLSTEIARREANQLGRPAQQMIAVVDRKKRASRLLELIFYLLSSLGTPGAALPQSCFQKENIPRPCHVNSANGPWMRRGIRRKLKGWALSTFRRCVERRSS